MDVFKKVRFTSMSALVLSTSVSGFNVAVADDRASVRKNLESTDAQATHLRLDSPYTRQKASAKNSATSALHESLIGVSGT